MWDKSKKQIMEMKVKDFLKMLTQDNWHTARVIVETIIDGRDDLIDRACKVKLQHSKDGEMTNENLQERLAIVKEMENQND